MTLFKIPRKSKEQKLAKLSPTQRAELDRIELDAIADFKGQMDDLESALGMLRIGHHFGWKGLYILHSKATIRKYEGILGISVRDTFPEVGPSSYRMMGYRLSETVSNFWKLVSGAAEEAKTMDRQERRRIEA